MLVKKTIALTKLQNLKNRIKIIRGGTSAGKTICILVLLIDYAIRNKGKEIIVVAESIPHLRRGALKDFLNILKGMQRFNEEKYNLLIKNTGNVLEMFKKSM